jgi:phytoene dehydrogenase-like protein
MSRDYDVVIVGGGHNGLAAAAYLALAGKRVVVLERLNHVGGAAVSAQAFDGVDARLSRYSYLVSLLPKRVIRDLGLNISLTRRRFSSYTPLPGTDRGLLIDNADPVATAASFATLDAVPDAAAWQRFYTRTAHLARALFPTVTEPLLRRGEARALVSDSDAWSDFIERPIGEVIEREFRNDLVRGVVLTDALIGTFAPNLDNSLAANRCFLYHVIGNGTGDWDVPVGGMGAVTGELWRAATLAGAEIVTGADVTSISPDGDVSVGGEVFHGSTVLANVAPYELARLLGDSVPTKPEGAQVKVNLLLSRLPALKGGVDPRAAFGGTFHINEGWGQLQAAFDAASTGAIATPLPCEIYCHSLSDPSILSPALVDSGAQTLTVFGLHVPDRFTPDATALEAAVLASLNSVLAEPIEPLLLRDSTGRPTIETKTTRDLEDALRMPGGNIFHGPLAWPFADDDDPLETPAQRWGVATSHEHVLLAGSGARRGGAVSALGGHNAAMAVLESSD